MCAYVPCTCNQICTAPQQQVWGIAYEIDDNENGNGGGAANAIWNQLDFREKNGYTRKICTFYPKNDSAQPFDLVVYISDPDNEWYAGEAPLAEIARSIISAKGKSGYNIDYLWQLARWMRTVVPEADDPHLFELEMKTRQLISQTDKLRNESVSNIS